jgi:hypothetical protein
MLNKVPEVTLYFWIIKILCPVYSTAPAACTTFATRPRVVRKTSSPLRTAGLHISPKPMTWNASRSHWP